jgi:hypothetical protein
MCRRACKFVLLTGALVGGGLIAANLPETVKGSGVPGLEDRAIGPIDEVILSGTGNLTITRGDLPLLTVTADDNLLPLIETETAGHQLHIRTKSGYNLRPATPLQYALTVPNLKKVTLSGSGTVRMAKFGGESLAVRLSGSADAAFHDLGYRELSLNLSGSGKIVLDGAATKVSVKVSGSGDVDASGLRSLISEVQVSGSGKIKVWATGNLNARVSGSGDIRYRGEPKIEKRVSGSGSVRPLD